jgi:hypothetical protein
MKYMLLIYMKEDQMPPAEREPCYKESTQVANDLAAAGQFITASPLQSITTATSVRIRENRRMVTDGPFAETREALGGFYMIDVPDLDAAIAVASRLPPAKKGTVEIRPIVELPNLPGANSAELAGAQR